MGAPNCSLLAQGTLTVEDLQWLFAKMPLPDGSLYIYESDLAHEEAIEIQKSSPDCYLNITGKSSSTQKPVEPKGICYSN